MSFEYLQWGNWGANSGGNPEGDQEGQPDKLIILLHGYARNGKIMEKQARELTALMPNALVVAPHGGEECVDYPARRQWFNIRMHREAVYGNLLKAASDMNGFIDKLCDQYGLSGGDVSVMGFSQGASLALYTGFARENNLASVVAHSIFFNEDMNLQKRALPILYLYGTQDEEFDPPVFWQGRDNLSALTDDMSVNALKDLTHKTSAYSRQVTARYIKARF